MTKYLLGVGVLVILFTGLLMWNKSRFSEKKLMDMIETPTKLKGLTADFCAYRTGLDPKEPDQRYVKINFKCEGNREALNTISWITITDPTVARLIQQVAKINGFDKSKVKFNCNIDGAIAVMESKLNVGNLITCKVN